MTRIIFHLGPGKCGSSAIRAHLRHVAAQPDAPLRATVPKGPEIRALEDGEPQVVQRFADLMAQTGARDLPLVISHEALFKKRKALLSLVAAAQEQGATPQAVAYVRRQSDFLRSVHAQWLFRMPDRIAETADLLRGQGIDPALFTGAERHLMAVALGHIAAGRQPGGQAYYDWSHSMAELAALLAARGVTLQVGALPPRDAPHPLSADFMARIGVADVAAPPQQGVVNAAFHPAMIEAVSAAIEQGFDMPGPHEANRFLATGDAAALAVPLPADDFLRYLGDCIDTRFEARNHAFALAFGIDPANFEPRNLCDPAALRDRIDAEVARRLETPAAERAAATLQRAIAARDAWARYKASNAP